MIRLVVADEQAEAMLVASAPYFRITGGAIWIGPGAEAGIPLVRFTGSLWQHGHTVWPGMRFEGKCRLIFGLARDPAGVSDTLDGVSVHGTVLSANGIPFAEYDPVQDMWHGVGARRWWHAFRIETVELRKSFHAPTGSSDTDSSVGPPDAMSRPAALNSRSFKPTARTSSQLRGSSHSRSQ